MNAAAEEAVGRLTLGGPSCIRRAVFLPLALFLGREPTFTFIVAKIVVVAIHPSVSYLLLLLPDLNKCDEADGFCLDHRPA